MPTNRDALRKIYIDTDYRVRLAQGGYATIRVGQPLPRVLCDALPHAGAPWAFVTAWNPLSAAQPVIRNRARQRELLIALRQLSPSVDLFTGVGVGERPPWREPSVFVTGVPFDRLDCLMQPFRQHALVRGHGDGAAELHWLE